MDLTSENELVQDKGSVTVTPRVDGGDDRDSQVLEAAGTVHAEGLQESQHSKLSENEENMTKSSGQSTEGHLAMLADTVVEGCRLNKQEDLELADDEGDSDDCFQDEILSMEIDYGTTKSNTAKPGLSSQSANAKHKASKNKTVSTKVNQKAKKSDIGITRQLKQDVNVCKKEESPEGTSLQVDNSKHFKNEKLLEVEVNKDREPETVRNLPVPGQQSAERLAEEESVETVHIQSIWLMVGSDLAQGFQCSVCSEVFQKSSSAEYHLKYKHNNLKKQLHCQVCGKKFKIKSDLDRHLNVHAGNRPYSCPECDKAFVCRSSLMRHRKLQHLVGDIFKCHVCEKTFRVDSDLTRHLSVHSGKKAWSCDQCNKTFSCKSSLKVHAKSHDDSQKFKCQVCSKMFHIKSDFDRHFDKHTGEPKWECAICGKKYTSKSAVKRHVKDSHILKKIKFSQSMDKKGMELILDQGDTDVDFDTVNSYIIYHNNQAVSKHDHLVNRKDSS